MTVFTGLEPPGVQFYRVNGFDVSVEDGGTAASNARDARRNLNAADRMLAYVIATADSQLPNAQALASLATGMLKVTTGTGLLSIATAADLPNHTHADSTQGGSSIYPLVAEIGSATVEGTLTIRSSTTSVYARLLFQDDNASNTYSLYLPTGALNPQTWKLPATVSGDLLVYGGGADPPAGGGIATVNRAGVSADVSPAVNLTNATVPGFYLINGMLITTTTGAGDCTVEVLFNDGFASRTLGIMYVDTSVTNSSDFQTQVAYLGTGNITWRTTGLGGAGGAQVTIRLRALYVGA